MSRFNLLRPGIDTQQIRVKYEQLINGKPLEDQLNILKEEKHKSKKHENTDVIIELIDEKSRELCEYQQKLLSEDHDSVVQDIEKIKVLIPDDIENAKQAIKALLPQINNSHMPQVEAIVTKIKEAEAAISRQSHEFQILSMVKQVKYLTTIKALEEAKELAETIIRQGDLSYLTETYETVFQKNLEELYRDMNLTEENRILREQFRVYQEENSELKDVIVEQKKLLAEMKGEEYWRKITTFLICEKYLQEQESIPSHRLITAYIEEEQSDNSQFARSYLGNVYDCVFPHIDEVAKPYEKMLSSGDI